MRKRVNRGLPRRLLLLPGAGCARIAGRLLPQPRGLVFAQCPLGRIGELRLPVECMQQQGINVILARFLF